jgi:prepilin-type processing-associated H-X9-DG protein
MWKYVEGNPKVFHCPQGIDQVEGSPTKGQFLQLSYAISGVTGGPSGKKISHITRGRGTSNVLHVWEHSRLPSCAFDTGTPWPFNDADAPNHYPDGRHIGRYNVLYCDGHVTTISLSELQIPMFYIN